MGKKFGPLLTLPELESNDHAYLQAFQALHRARSYHMGGPNPISLSDIDAYTRLTGFSDDLIAKRVLLKQVTALDDCFIEFSADKRKAAAESAKRERERNRGRR